MVNNKMAKTMMIKVMSWGDNLVSFFIRQFILAHILHKPFFLAGLVQVVYTKQMNFNNQTIWVEVNLGAIRRNIKRVEAHTKRPVMAVVKANAYGHGLFEVSKAAVEAGAARLCVARTDEAIRMRQEGINAPILVLGYTTPDMIENAILNDLALMVNSVQLIDAFNQAAAAVGRKVTVHAKIDTGMGRLGVPYTEGVAFVKHILGLKNVVLEGVFTHFACADEPSKPITNLQIERFDQVIEELSQAGIRPPILHAANSAGSIYFPKGWYDAVRPGIAIYGLNPSTEAPLPEGFEPALSWKCRLSSVKDLPEGSGVSYGHRYFTRGLERIAAASIGYADGLRRWSGNVALIDGKRVPQVGTVCMDQTMWRLDDRSNAKAGDEMVLIGRQGDECISADELAAAWGTINYEVICGLMDRVPRFYIDE